MATDKDFYINFVRKLLNPIPQYVLGSLPAIAIVGETPREKFAEKIAWVLRCLGCPFTGLFYSCNVGVRKQISVYTGFRQIILKPKSKSKVDLSYLKSTADLSEFI